MRLASDITPTQTLANPQMNPTQDSSESRYTDFKTIRRNGSVGPFQPEKITLALTKAFLAVEGGQGAASARIRDICQQLTESVIKALMRSQPNGGMFHIEDIQDHVELAL